jgi:hypothetical protein
VTANVDRWLSYVTHWLFHVVNTCFTCTPIRSVDNACKKKYIAYVGKRKSEKRERGRRRKERRKKRNEGAAIIL